MYGSPGGAMVSRNQADAVNRYDSGPLQGGTPRWRAVLLLGLLTVLVGLTALATAGATLAGGSSGTAATTWKAERTPNPGGAQISFLSSVACPSRRSCVAVGGFSKTLSSASGTLAERWDGTRWRIQSIPTPTGTSDSLYGVSCLSARACVAVGGAFHKAGKRQTTLTEAWDGKRWRVQSTPTIKGPSSLYAVSCTSASWCVAVGHTVATPQRAIIESWDGNTWSVEAIPALARDTELSGVSCSSARACSAVGWNNASGTTRPIDLSWDGVQWQVRAVTLPGKATAGLLDAVSCTSPTACTATGTDFDHPNGPTLAERWNGKTWRAERTQNPPDFATSQAEVVLDGVSCASAKACTAIGEYNPGGRTEYFIEFWNGKRWALEPAPRPTHFAHGALLGISCASARCTAVGAYTGNVRLQVTLALAN